MIVSFMEGIEHSLDHKQISNLADRIPGWSGSDIQVCRPGKGDSASTDSTVERKSRSRKSLVEHCR